MKDLESYFIDRQQ